MILELYASTSLSLSLSLRRRSLEQQTHHIQTTTGSLVSIGWLLQRYVYVTYIEQRQPTHLNNKQALGEFVALPSVVMSGLHIHRKMTQKKVTLLGMIRELACFRSVAFGLLTGFTISIGYMCYLNAITVLPSTTVFPIVSCNPVVSVIYNVVVLGEFKNSPRSRWLWLFLALVCYGAAIATIATIPKK